MDLDHGLDDDVPMAPQTSSEKPPQPCANGFAEIHADGVYHPISCDLHNGHEGPHRWTFTVVTDDTTTYARAEWPT